MVLVRRVWWSCEEGVVVLSGGCGVPSRVALFCIPLLVLATFKVQFHRHMLVYISQEMLQT